MVEFPKIVIENSNVPGYRSQVDALKYHAIRDALLRTLPKTPPGLTQRELFVAVLPYLPETLFPGGEKSSWWVKRVQLDLEAKGRVRRVDANKPVRWHRA
jgi:hypothetical protein